MRHIIAKVLLVAVSVLATTAHTPSAMMAEEDFSGSFKAPQVKVTAEELELAARFEDRPLFMGIDKESVLHYPGNKSHAVACSQRGCTNGCTIGFGYNLGARNAKQTMRELTPILGKRKAAELANYAGLKGEDAYNACGPLQDQDDLPKLSRASSWELLKFSMVPHKAQVMNRIAREGLQDALNAEQVAVLVALDFQNPRLASRATKLWKHIHRGDLERVAYEIRNHSGTKYLRALQNRRNTEADLWMAAL